jgi:hypothetical protein
MMIHGTMTPNVGHELHLFELIVEQQIEQMIAFLHVMIEGPSIGTRLEIAIDLN